MGKYFAICCNLTFLLIFGCVTNTTFAPSVTYTTPRTGFLADEQIDVVFFDSRTEKDQSEELQNSILNHLKKTYPAASFKCLISSEYFSSPKKGKLTLKINIVGYHAGFGVESTSGIGTIKGQPFVFNGVADGKWNGLTGLGVMVYDYRNGENKFTKEISEVESRKNTGGYSTARNAVQTSFQNVMNNLSSFIDQSLMK